MPNYVIAFDDSGGIEPLCDWGGEPIPGSFPIAVLTGFFVDTVAHDAFVEEWNGLRSQMQARLACEHLPPMHMRLMWGRTLPPKYRGQSNPFRNASFADIKTWVGAGFDIIASLAKRRQAGWIVFSSIREENHPFLKAYFTDPFFLREMKFLRRHSGDMYRGYHRLSTSPLLNLYTRSLLGVDEIARARGPDSTMSVLVDSFSDSHGIDELETVEAVLGVASLERIARVERVPNADDVPLVQAADLLGFRSFREEMHAQGAIEKDETLADLAKDCRDGLRVTTANIPHRVTRRYPRWPDLGLTMHYALARAHAVRWDERFATEYLISVEEFKGRIHQRPRGVSVLTQAAYTRMAKTPD